jgi:hypothetical protein
MLLWMADATALMMSVFAIFIVSLLASILLARRGLSGTADKSAGADP